MTSSYKNITSYKDDLVATFSRLEHSKYCKIYILTVSTLMLSSMTIANFRGTDVSEWTLWTILFFLSIFLLIIPSGLLASLIRYNWRGIETKCTEYVITDRGLMIRYADTETIVKWEKIEIKPETKSYFFFTASGWLNYFKKTSVPDDFLSLFLKKTNKSRG